MADRATGLGLAGASAIVTGGASNIGRAITLALAAEGAHVSMLDIDADQARRTAAEADGLTGTVTVVPCDTTEPAQVDAAVTTVVDRSQRIDVLVNNVGWSRPAWFADVTLEEMDKAVRVNLMSTIYCTRAVLSTMRAQGRGAIVSVASDAAFGELRSSVYGAAKGGVISFTKGLAREAGRDGVRLNVVAPGLVLPSGPEASRPDSLWSDGEDEVMDDRGRHDILRSIPLRRLTAPEDVAGSVLYLASHRLAAQVTGQVISVSGGRQMP